MRIPDVKIDEVRNATDIIDVISVYVRLKKRGKNYTGLCPFHQEKTPSFTVSAEKQMYHCFGCGVGGNVFTFVMEHDKVSFVEAVRSLADRAGIVLPAEGAEDKAQATETEALYAACRAAGLFFHNNLYTTGEGKLVLEYFRHRGFTDETIRKFGLGCSLNSWDALLKHAEGEHLDPVILEKAGLLVRREESGTGGPAGGTYDRFRGRAMFPIFSASGRTIAFGARKMREDDPMGKYINSPETPIYNKSRVLYGLYQAREAIRDKEFAILVEGYADLISVAQAGIGNIVASSGTALTEEQILLLERYTRNITLVYDADSAGSKATLRGVDLIMEKGLEVKVAELPAGEDPDSFVRKEGGEAFQKLLDHAVSYLEFTWKTFQSQGLLDTPDGKTRAVRSIVETIARIKDELRRDFYIKSISERYGVYESVLFRELEKLLGREKRFSDARAADRALPAASGSAPGQQAALSAVSAAERDLLKVMLESGTSMVQFVVEQLQDSGFTHPLARKLLEMLQNEPEYGGGQDVNALLDRIDDPALSRFVSDIVFSKHEISKGWGELEEPDPRGIARQSVARLHIGDLDRRIAEQHLLMREAGARGEPVLPFQQEIQSLQQQRKKEQLNAEPEKRPAE